MNAGVTLFRVRGIPVEAHVTWVLAFPFLYQFLVYGFFPARYPDLHQGAYIALGLASTLLFFGSIVLHEFGHAYQALREGMAVHRVTLWIYGGVFKSAEGFVQPQTCG